jgi:hypothetical protein
MVADPAAAAITFLPKQLPLLKRDESILKKTH